MAMGKACGQGYPRVSVVGYVRIGKSMRLGWRQEILESRMSAGACLGKSRQKAYASLGKWAGDRKCSWVGKTGQV